MFGPVEKEMEMKRDTFVAGHIAKAMRSPAIEAAQHLASTCRRFVAGRCLKDDVEDAIKMWRESFQPTTTMKSTTGLKPHDGERFKWECPRCDSTGLEELYLSNASAEAFDHNQTKHRGRQIAVVRKVGT